MIPAILRFFCLIEPAGRRVEVVLHWGTWGRSILQVYRQKSSFDFLLKKIPVDLLFSSEEKMSYYAVRNGRNPGVYHSWDECSEQVNQYSNAKYKKFDSSEGAWDFVNQGSSSGYKASYEDSYSSEEYYSKPETYSRGYNTEPAVVYTDGSCASNGRSGARAGIGVYWGENHPLNVGERLPGRQTNQRAEIQAACTAVAQAKSQNITKLDVCTDSKFTIDGITKWVPTWQKNDWTLTTGEPVKNKDDFQRLHQLSKGMDITWKHVPGHAGYNGNEAANELAREGAMKPLTKY